jgi:hypothetical protein
VSAATNVRHGAVGFRVKSGLAIAVLVAGPVRSPRALDRRVVELCDPDLPASRQPYHASMGTLQTDEAKVDTLRKAITRAAGRSVTALMRDYRKAGHDVRSAGLVAGSLVDPATITNPHIRAHALEGRLFRDVLEEALRPYGLACRVVVEREVYARAAESLGRSEPALKRAVAQLGRELGGPWRADEKTAALAAWMVLT